MGYFFIIFTKNTVSEREFSQRSKMLPVTAKILLCYANCLCKLSFMYIELPVLKGDLVEEGSYLHGAKDHCMELSKLVVQRKPSLTYSTKLSSHPIT